MIWLIWAIRSAFCKHEFVIEEFKKYGRKLVEVNYIDKWFSYEEIYVSATCKHCGWHRRYQKA